MAGAFFKYNESNVNEDANDEDCDDETELAAAGCLNAIKTILSSGLPQETYYKIEDLIIPVINFALSEEGCDYIEDGLGILNAILYNVKVISEKMWNYYPVLNYIIAGKPKEFNTNINPETLSPEKKLLLGQTESGWGYEYIEEMMGCFQNYIQKGKGLLLTAKDPAFNITLIELLFKTIDKIYEIHSVGSQDVEMVVATTLYICVIENLFGQIDVVIPYIIDKCMNVLTKGNTKNLKKIQIETVIMLFYLSFT